MRARGIKPGFYKNESLADCSLPARFLFPGLWMMADREGRLEDRPRKIKVEILPFDDIDVEPLLRELHANGFIERYSVGGEKFIQINNFTKHQAPHVKEKASEIPDVSGADHRPSSAEPGKGSVEHRESPGKVGASTRQAPVLHPLTPSSLTPDSGLLTADSTPRSVDISSAQTPENLVSPTAQQPPAATPVSDPPKKREQATGTRLPVDWYLSQELGDWALGEGLTREQIRLEAERFRDYWISKPGAGGRKADWAATWRNWIRRSNYPGGNSHGKNQPPDRPRSAVDRVNAAISARAREREQREALQRGGRIFDGDGVTMATDG